MSEERGMQRRETGTEQPLSPLESAMLEGDLSKLSPPERLEFYKMRCEVAGLDPRASPFQYVRLSGKLVLYPGRAASDQLTGARGVSVDVLSEQVMPGGIFYVKSRARDATGRTADDVGAVPIEGLKSDLLANAIKKAVTQSKRRAVLSFCGLAMPDETEVDQIPGAQRIHVSDQGEVLGELPAPAPPAAAERPHDLDYWRRRTMALYTELGGVPSERDACRADLAAILGIEPGSRTLLTAEQWQRCAEHMERQLRESPIPVAADDGDDPFGDAEADTVPVPPRESSGAGLAQQSGL